MEQYIKDNSSNEDQKLFLEIYEDLKSLKDFWMGKHWSKTLKNLILIQSNFGRIIDNKKSSEELEYKKFVHNHCTKK